MIRDKTSTCDYNAWIYVCEHTLNKPENIISKHN